MRTFAHTARTVTTAALLLATTLANAGELAAPTGEVILTVSGAIENTNGPDGASFDLAMLQELGSETFTTTTMWTEGVLEFTGVPFEALMAAVGATGTTAKSVAANDYAVEMPIAEMQAGPIVAYFLNGEEMSLRDKGPLWIVYPYDSSADFQSEVVFSRSIWQLVAIEVTE